VLVHNTVCCEDPHISAERSLPFKPHKPLLIAMVSDIIESVPTVILEMDLQVKELTGLLFTPSPPTPL